MLATSDFKHMYVGIVRKKNKKNMNVMVEGRRKGRRENVIKS